MAGFVARALMVTCATAALTAGSAHAGNVYWSVGINAPIAPGVAVGTVISNGHVVPVVPVVAPPVYLPAPIYAPPPVVYAPRVVYGPPVWVGGGWAHRYPYKHHKHHGWHGHDRGWRSDHRGPPQYVPRRPGREIRY